MVQRLHGSLTAQSVQGPEDQYIELTAGCSAEHLLELLAVAVLAAGFVNVLVNNLPLLRLGECPELDELILVVLPFVLSAHSCVQCNSLCHGGATVSHNDRKLAHLFSLLNPTPIALA